MRTLWYIEIDEADWNYDRFQSAVVWAETAEEAEQIIRAEKWEHDLWIERPEWRLHVKPAPTEGVALIHWHAG